MSAHSYAECLQNSYRVNWTIADVVAGRHFDATRPWLPARLSGAGRVAFCRRQAKWWENWNTMLVRINGTVRSRSMCLTRMGTTFGDKWELARPERHGKPSGGL